MATTLHRDSWDQYAAICERDIAALKAALKECADDLEASVKAEYHGTLDYPSQKRKYDRDMGPVLRARSLLD